MTFHIAVAPTIEADLSTEDRRAYRIRAAATAQATGAFLGAALGACSSDEEKYKWRAAVCDEEFAETPADRRRNKWKKSDQTAYAIKQVRTEPADIDNTVLKMAVKRAVVAVILQVTAASDIFTQDIEDLPDEVLNEVANEGGKPKPDGNWTGLRASTGNAISDPQRARAFAIGKSKGFSTEQYRTVIKKHGFDSDKDITKGAKYEAIVAELEKGVPAA
jgi:hypothetical protein